MQATQYPLTAARVILLNKLEICTSSGVKCLLTKAFVEKATGITQDLRLNHHHTRNGAGYCFHQRPLDCMTRSKYWP